MPKNGIIQKSPLLESVGMESVDALHLRLDIHNFGTGEAFELLEALDFKVFTCGQHENCKLAIMPDEWMTQEMLEGDMMHLLLSDERERTRIVITSFPRGMEPAVHSYREDAETDATAWLKQRKTHTFRHITLGGPICGESPDQYEVRQSILFITFYRPAILAELTGDMADWDGISTQMVELTVLVDCADDRSKPIATMSWEVPITRRGELTVALDAMNTRVIGLLAARYPDWTDPLKYW